MKYLIDASVLADAVRGHLAIVLKLQALKPSDVAVSVFSQVEAEIALRLKPAAQARYGKLLKEFLGAVHRLDFGAAEAQQAVVIGSYLRAAGETLAPLDLWLAATATARRLTLVTDRGSAFAAVPNLDIETWS
ncbi:PIN domain-containing protein [Solimonas terrae]|uniref:Type II toxin-antitoxin system VapC family toxin n=1 Tax=Solimonas terrae TaxID=1396819 RepID=A0A6M2BUX2_9GAMM|nr:type II toxin-antitoxin system VapC family toxin [Solimonas terrae]